jgi:GT2 family glycosyltransferase
VSFSIFKRTQFDLTMTISVIIVTLNRSDCVRRCLECLFSQNPQPDQVIVVDASADDLTRNVVADFDTTLYLRNENGYGRMTASRNIGIAEATGDIIAFLDDDAFPHEGWLRNTVDTFSSSLIGGVGGRALNQQPNEEHVGKNEIGTLTQSGELKGFFAADPGQTIEVDHIMGCNMSFRRNVIAELGGFREDYPGISGVREDSDMCLRVKRLGYKIVFNPLACVDHIGAPQAKGKRFDTRYAFYSAHNHLVLLIRNFGLFSGIVWRYIFYSCFAFIILPFAKEVTGAFVRLLVTFLGSALGIGSGIMLLLRTGSNPLRRDADADRLRNAMRSNRTESKEVN